jgi:hypothetical protein
MLAVVCMTCGDLLRIGVEYQYINDYKECYCKSITIKFNGGLEYLLRGDRRLMYPIYGECKYNEYEKLSRHDRRDKIYIDNYNPKDNVIVKDWNKLINKQSHWIYNPYIVSIFKILVFVYFMLPCIYTEEVQNHLFLLTLYCLGGLIFFLWMIYHYYNPYKRELKLY